MGARLHEILDEPEQWTLYASPLGRARQTALLVCQQLGLEPACIHWEGRLVELGMGCRLPDLLEDHPELDVGKPD